MISSDFRTEARRRLSGKWGKVVCISLAYIAIFFVLGLVEGLFPDSTEIKFSIINLVIGVPLVFGLIIAFMKLYNDEEVKTFDFLTLGFSNFAKSWKISLHILLKMIVPIILVIISYFVLVIGAFGGGALLSSVDATVFKFFAFGTLAIVGFILLIVSIIWAITKPYYYKLAYFVAVDNSDLTAKEAVEKSQELMTGKRAKLFWLELSFIGWVILSAIPLFIGNSLGLPLITLAILLVLSLLISYLFLAPYILFATIAFYKFVSGNTSNVEPSVITENNDNPIQGE